MVTDLENYLFDLRGYLHLEGALTGDEVKDLNYCLDAIPPLEPGDWYGHVHAHTYGTVDGLNLQQIYEAGEPFERMIDHPAWIEKVKHFVGGEGTFDYAHGPLFIDENFANFRQPGEAIGLHSGGYPPIMRNQFRYHRGRYMCGQINILVALTDIGPGDGGTMLIPGSHKSNFTHPDLDRHRMRPKVPLSRASPARSSATWPRATPCSLSMASRTARPGAKTRAHAGFSSIATDPPGATSATATTPRTSYWRA